MPAAIAASAFNYWLEFNISVARVAEQFRYIGFTFYLPK